MLTHVLDVSLLSGGLPVAVAVLGLGALAVLVARRDRWWWRVGIPLALEVAVIGAALTGILANTFWRPFPDPVPARVLFWVGLAMFAVGLTVASCWRYRTEDRHRRLRAVPLGLLVVVLAATQVNAVYGYYPTVRSVLGLNVAREVAFAKLDAQRSTTAPKVGLMSRVSIPGTQSGFPARQGLVYVPPAYLSAQKPTLPVLVMIADQPGSPDDWLAAGDLPRIMDQFAAAHDGLAPVVVIPDVTGGPLANPMCLDSALGNVETYLARDVPQWITQNLRVDPDTRRWAIGGFAAGGTCALQMAVRAPTTYPVFLDISGQDEPTLGDRAHTVRAAFGGDTRRFAATNPLDVLAASRFPQSRGFIVVGGHDTAYGPQARRVYTAITNAGMRALYIRVPGGHSWTVARAGLRVALLKLAREMRLVTD